MLSKMLSKIMCFLGHRFRMDFGSVLPGFWTTKVLNFRSFFDVFAELILQHASDEQKMRAWGDSDFYFHMGRPDALKGSCKNLI